MGLRSLSGRRGSFLIRQKYGLSVRLLRKLVPEQVALIQEQADQICLHRFALLGYENLDYGPVIDWHLDLVNGKRAPRKSGSKFRI